MLENGQHNEALNEYNDVLKQRKAMMKNSCLEKNCINIGFLDEAKALIENLLVKYYPEEGELLVLLGEILVEAGEDEEAILVLERISEHDANFGQSLLLLADLISSSRFI